MRACSGCRKRKIKCDAATTNTWPCSACTRLKLVCIPPTIGQDGDFSSHGQMPEVVQQSAPINALEPAPLDIAARQISHPQRSSDETPAHAVSGSRVYDHDVRPYQAQSYLGHLENQRRLYHEVPPPHLVLLQHSFHQPQ